MRTVLVTGGTLRLGFAIAERLRAGGWRVLTSSHRPDADADLVADLEKPEAADELMSACRALNGGELPAALVNNAALFTGSAAALMQVNCLAPMRLTELMASRGDGRGAVVNVLDTRILNRTTVSGTADPYAASKARLRDFTLAAAHEFRDRLRVNAVAPGPVLAPTAVHERAGTTPLGRPTAAAVAEAVAFLLAAEFTSGVLLPVDGGQHLSDDAAIPAEGSLRDPFVDGVIGDSFEIQRMMGAGLKKRGSNGWSSR